MLSHVYKLLVLATFGSFAIFLLSCGSPRYVYAPSLPTPILTEKGEIRVAGFYAGEGTYNETGERHEGYELQASYAISDRLALHFSHNHRTERTIYGSLDAPYVRGIFKYSDTYYNRRMTQLAIGYTQPLGAQRGNSISFQMGLGSGYAHMRETGIDIDDQPYSAVFDNRLFRFFAEPAFRVRFGNAVRLTVSSRISIVRFTEQQNSFSASAFDYLELGRVRNQWEGFFEPALYWQIAVPRFSWVKAELGLQFCSDPEVNVVEARSLTPFIGLAFDPSGFWRKKK